ncbi:MAG: DNA cytosine methyltransferase [Candidatus Delongbacteria bacterium]|nr:DNA cytosine methyltransferase [Candidatus Delongbacteria bacterium]
MKRQNKHNITDLKTFFCKEDEQIYNLRSEGGLLKPQQNFKLIDLFCGAGGMTLGFTEAFGHYFEPIWANDFNKYCVDTYNANFGNHCLTGDIVDILSDKTIIIPKADVVIGGPPCQGFSLLNRNRDDDPRRQLWRPYLEVVERSDAKVFVIENVAQLLGTFEHGEIVGMAEKLGFKVFSSNICAADYGVPQTRIRAIIIGSRIGEPSFLFPPRKTHYNPNSNGHYQGRLDFSGNEDFLPSSIQWQTVRDAIADLPPPIGTDIRDVPPPLNLHFGRTPTEMSMKRYRAIPKEGMNRFDLQKYAPELTPQCWIRKTTGGTDLFGRLWWNRPAFTIRTEFYKPEKGRYLHPEQHRPITHREAARFQSFPDSFIFKGSKIEIAKQIGNAVPPLMAARIADIVYVLLTKG